MKAIAIKAGIKLLGTLFSVISPDMLKDIIDTILDVIEKKVRETKNPIDDIIVLPLCATIRKAFNVPDDDEDQLKPE